MKRVQLVEFGIIIVGLIFGYKFFEGIFSVLMQIIYSFEFGRGDIVSTLAPTVLITVGYAVCFMLLIKRSGQLANYLCNDDAGGSLRIKIGKSSLLQVVLMGICLVTILSNIAEILVALYETFKHEAGRQNFREVYTSPFSTYSFKIAAVNIIVAIVVLYFAKDISAWFLRKNEPDELSFESDTEKDQ